MLNDCQLLGVKHKHERWPLKEHLNLDIDDPVAHRPADDLVAKFKWYGVRKMRQEALAKQLRYTLRGAEVGALVPVEMPLSRGRVKRQEVFQVNDPLERKSTRLKNPSQWGGSWKLDRFESERRALDVPGS